MLELTEADKLEVWLVLNLLGNCHRDDYSRLCRKAEDLVYRLRKEGKINRPAGSTTIG
jgi:hypothetical protein